MLQKTPALVLQSHKYRDSSLIVRMYTRALGLQSYLVNGVRSQKTSLGKAALFQPLTLLDMVVYHRPNAQLHRLKEVRCLMPYQSIPFHVAKSSVALFLAEILGKVLREETENAALFDFLQARLTLLDMSEPAYPHFHIQLLLHLTAYLGFAPSTAHEILQQLGAHRALHAYYADVSMLEQALNQLLHTPPHEPLPFPPDSRLRQGLIDAVLDFYRLHNEHLDPLKSLEVLRALND